MTFQTTRRSTDRARLRARGTQAVALAKAQGRGADFVRATSTAPRVVNRSPLGNKTHRDRFVRVTYRGILTIRPPVASRASGRGAFRQEISKALPGLSGRWEEVRRVETRAS